ncbi:MAG: hypothetical protein ABIM88_06940 [candidate division WOR-3 bacterium]
MPLDDYRKVIYDFAGSKRLVIERYGPGRYRVRLFHRQRWFFFLHSWTIKAMTVIEAEDDSEAMDKAVDWATGIGS